MLYLICTKPLFESQIVQGINSCKQTIKCKINSQTAIYIVTSNWELGLAKDQTCCEIFFAPFPYKCLSINHIFMKIYVRVFSLLSHKSSWEKYKWKTLRVTCASDTEALPSLPCHTDMHSWKKWEHTATLTHQI